MTMITPSLVPSSDPLVTAASVLEFALAAIHLYVHVFNLAPKAAIGTVSTAPAPEPNATGLL